MTRQAQSHPPSSNFISFLFSLLVCSVLLGVVVTAGLVWYEDYLLAATVGSATVGIIFLLYFFVSSLTSTGGNNNNMNQQNTGPSPAAQLGSRLVSMLIVAVLVGATFTWLFVWMEEYILAGIVGTASVALLLTLIVSLASLFSSHRTMKIMREGAEIAIAAMGQNDNGRYDAQMAKTYADVFSAGAKVSSTQRHQFYPGNGQPAGLPALPLPSQDVQAWMPPITTMTIEGEPQDPPQNIFEDPSNMEPLE